MEEKKGVDALDGCDAHKKTSCLIRDTHSPDRLANKGLLLAQMDCISSKDVK